MNTNRKRDEKFNAAVRSMQFISHIQKNKDEIEEFQHRTNFEFGNAIQQVMDFIYSKPVLSKEESDAIKRLILNVFDTISKLLRRVHRVHVGNLSPTTSHFALKKYMQSK